MAANNFSFLPKSVLVRIADMFQNRENGEQSAKAQEAKVRQISETEEEETLNEEAKPLNSKLNITLKDLKTISTALLHYRRSLNKMGESLRAEQVAEIDKKFYQILQQLEGQATTNNANDTGNPVAA